jgi:hypothetical protein
MTLFAAGCGAAHPRPAGVTPTSQAIRASFQELFAASKARSIPRFCQHALLRPAQGPADASGPKARPGTKAASVEANRIDEECSRELGPPDIVGFAQQLRQAEITQIKSRNGYIATVDLKLPGGGSRPNVRLYFLHVAGQWRLIVTPPD